MEMTNFTVVSAVLRNNYWSRNLIGPYRFWVISPRNLTSFTRPFLAGRHARAGHETSSSQGPWGVGSLIPRPLPDIISQLWRISGRRPEIIDMSWTRNGGLG